MAGVMAWRVPAIDWWRRRPDQRDLVAIEMLYVAVVGLFWPIFPMLGWGTGVFFHGWDTFRRPLTESRIQAEMDRKFEEGRPRRPRPTADRRVRAGPRLTRP